MSKEKIKCVVWDLDNTVWNGTVMEDEDVTPNHHAVQAIHELDNRGILQSVSSKNDYDLAKQKLEQFGLWEYFIYPQISWRNKSESVVEIARSINIGIDTLAFVDDQTFEREEVSFSNPEVLCIDVSEIPEMLLMDRMMPKFVTGDSKNRRKMYQNDIKANVAEKEFVGTKEEFLQTLDMCLTIGLAQEDDLQRMEELTVRTHQLNSTGYIYSYNELRDFIHSDNHIVLVAQLDDKYGSSGKIGVALIEKQEQTWGLKLLLMSCRVMTKGVGGVLLNYILNLARENNVALTAQFVPSERNRIMYITYKLNGFSERKMTDGDGGRLVLEADMSYERRMPDYVTVVGKVA